MNEVVLDTNVLVSALLTNGHPATIIDLFADGKLLPFYNGSIISEYWDVLCRPKFGFRSVQVVRLIDDIVRKGIAVEIDVPSIISMNDESDRKFYDVAKNSGLILITGNIKHYPHEPFILSPAAFIRIVSTAGPGSTLPSILPA